MNPDKHDDKENMSLKMYDNDGNYIWEFNLENPPGEIVEFEMDADLALKIGNAILDAFDNDPYHNAIKFPEDEIPTEVYEADQGYYVVLRYSSRFLGGESGVVISKEDGKVRRIWVG